MPEVLRHSALSSVTFSDGIGLGLLPEEKHMHWIRWIYASINKYFNDILSPIYPVYIEGDERTLQNEAEFIEVRIDGPFITQPCSNLYYIDIEINLLVQTHQDKKDLYKTQRAVGAITKAFNNVICVYRYGDEDFDDGTLLGVLKLQKDLRESIDVNYYGIIREDTRLLQSTVEGHYRLELEN